MTNRIYSMPEVLQVVTPGAAFTGRGRLGFFFYGGVGYEQRLYDDN